MNLRCEVSINLKLESILEADEDTVFDHIKESFKMHDEDSAVVTVCVRHASQLDWKEKQHEQI